MPIVNCSYSFAITDLKISERDRLTALRECARTGCVRCLNALDPGPQPVEPTSIKAKGDGKDPY